MVFIVEFGCGGWDVWARNVLIGVECCGGFFVWFSCCACCEVADYGLVLFIGCFFMDFWYWLSEFCWLLLSMWLFWWWVGCPTIHFFYKGTYFVIYELVMDFFGLALLVGCGWFLLWWISLVGEKESIGWYWMDRFVFCVLLLIGLSGYLVEGLCIFWVAIF